MSELTKRCATRHSKLEVKGRGCPPTRPEFSLTWSEPESELDNLTRARTLNHLTRLEPEFYEITKNQRNKPENFNTPVGHSI